MAAPMAHAADNGLSPLACSRVKLANVTSGAGDAPLDSAPRTEPGSGQRREHHLTHPRRPSAVHARKARDKPRGDDIIVFVEKIWVAICKTSSHHPSPDGRDGPPRKDRAVLAIQCLSHTTASSACARHLRSTALCLSLLACAGADAPLVERPTDAATAQTESTDGDASVGCPDCDTAVEPALPGTAAGRQLRWLLELVNTGGGKAPTSELEQHFHESFLASVPVDYLAATLQALASELAPLDVVQFAEQADGNRLMVLISSEGGPIDLMLEVEPATGSIVGLTFQPSTDLDGRRPDTLEQVEANLTTLAESSEYLVAKLENGSCQPISARRSGSRLAIGSTFKLYIMAELARQIDQGTLTWDSMLTVRDELKSLPSGRLQDVTDGTELNVEEFATPMISISDNTATDHLLAALGREQVEQMFTQSGHGAPEMNIPLLSTRELFLFKLDLSETEVDSYLDASVQERREFLESLSGRAPTLANAASWSQPRLVDEIEWFANVDDLCSVMATLLAMTDGTETSPVLQVLSENPGLPIDTEQYPYVGFKGGSEPGVLQLTWLVRDRNDEWYVVALTLNDTSRPIADEELALATAMGLFDLLAAE